jgi:nitroreductase/Pyruvate/2-oxoacid:ferredoxin oxidoreductase delta subunit
MDKMEMQIIHIDHDKCTFCKQCINVCHDYCIGVDGGNRIVINHALCDCCTQCLAVCPTQALDLPGSEVKLIDRTRLPQTEQLEELFKARRSIREYQDKKIARELLERIVEIGRYAPTMDKTIRAIIVDDKGQIDTLEGFTQRYYKRMYTLFFKNRVVLGVIKCFFRSAEIIKSKMEHRERNLFGAPAMVLLVGNRKNDYLSELSAQYYLYNMMLYAYSLGVGAILSDAGKIAFNSNREVYRLLGIPRGYRILGVLLLGYPKLKFKNKIEGLKVRSL